jgi:hypothetical protein
LTALRDAKRCNFCQNISAISNYSNATTAGQICEIIIEAISDFFTSPTVASSKNLHFNSNSSNPQQPFLESKCVSLFPKISDRLTAVAAVAAESLIAVTLLKFSSFDTTHGNS